MERILGKVAITPKGEWVLGAYDILDLVTYEGSSYLSRKPTSQPLSDESAWQLVAERGQSFRYEDLTPSQIEELQEPASNARGWSPLLVSDTTTISGKILLKLQSWIGGTGTAPTINVGQWQKADGTYTTVASDANDIRGDNANPIKGVATQANAPTPWVAGDPDLFEKWEVTTPITAASAWGIDVTQAELDENSVFFNVTNGVISKFTQPILRGADGQNKIEKWVPDTYTEGEQRITADGWFEVRAGMTAAPTDVPSKDSLVWEVISAGVSVSPVFDPTTETEAQGGKQITDFLIENKKPDNSENEEIWNSFADNCVSINDGYAFVSGMQTLNGLNADGIKKLILNFKTRPNGIGGSVVYGLKNDNTFAEIYDVVDTVLTNFEVDIPQNVYKKIYINMTKSIPATVKVIRENDVQKLFASFDVEKKVDNISQSLYYFLLGADGDESLVSFIGNGAYTANGVVIPLGGYNIIHELDAKGIYKVELSGNTHSIDQGIITLYGRKQDNSYETIWDVPQVTVSNLTIPIEPEKYKALFLNLKSNSANPPLKVYKKTDILNNVKKYVDANSGGQGGGIDVSETLIFAELMGVNSNNSGTVNTALLNDIFETNKTKGATVILPRGIIEIAGTLEVWNTISLRGALRGGIAPFSGTVISATTSDVMINVKKLGNNDQAQTISDMQILANNVASKCIYVGAGMAFFTFENMYIGEGATDVAIETEGALIYTMRNLRIDGKNGIRIRRTQAYQCNLIRFDFVQFGSIPKVAVEINGGAQIVFENCDWENNGTTGDINTGNVLISNMSPSEEGIDLTFNNCWSEYVYGGFWLKMGADCRGVTTFRDCMLWRLSGTAAKGIINNGSRVLLTGSTRIDDFPTDIETTNNGQTRVDGFTKIATHTESSGGTYKTVTYS